MSTRKRVQPARDDTSFPVATPHIDSLTIDNLQLPDISFVKKVNQGYSKPVM